MQIQTIPATLDGKHCVNACTICCFCALRHANVRARQLRRHQAGSAHRGKHGTERTVIFCLRDHRPSSRTLINHFCGRLHESDNVLTFHTRHTHTKKYFNERPSSSIKLVYTDMRPSGITPQSRASVYAEATLGQNIDRWVWFAFPARFVGKGDGLLVRSQRTTMSPPICSG